MSITMSSLLEPSACWDSVDLSALLTIYLYPLSTQPVMGNLFFPFVISSFEWPLVGVHYHLSVVWQLLARQISTIPNLRPLTAMPNTGTGSSWFAEKPWFLTRLFKDLSGAMTNHRLCIQMASSLPRPYNDPTKPWVSDLLSGMNLVHPLA
jgi:hypothetical protein